MQSETAYRMPAFREMFRDLSDEEYARIEDALEAYLLLTIRFVFQDIAAGRVSLTTSGEASTMENGPGEPATNPSNP